MWLIIFSVRIYQIGGLKSQPNLSTSSSALSSLQQSLSAQIRELLPPTQAALLNGMLLGLQSDLPRTFKDDLKTTSTIHMVVVSGQNLTILAAFVMSAAGFLGRKKTAGLTLGVILFYAILAGLGTPVIRAAIMAGLTYLSQIFGRERSAVWTLGLTAAVMLLFDPNYLFNISFQLSFLATLGVVVVAPLLNARLIWLPAMIRQDLSATMSAQILTLPIIGYNFGMLSLVGVMANLFLLWTVPFVMIIGAVALILSYVSLFLGQVVGLGPGIILTYFIYIVQFFAQLPGAAIKLPATNLYIWAGYYLVVIGLVWSLSLKKLR